MALFPRKPSDKRKQYRVRVDQDLSVSILLGDEWRQVPLLDATSRGAGVLLDLELAKRFERGLGVRLRFALRGRGRSVQANGVVRNNEDVESQFGIGVRLGIEFLEIEDFYAHLDANYWRYFNRRHSFRVQLSGSLPEARLVWPGKHLDGRVIDLCTAGCAIACPPDAEFELPETQGRLEFTIPDTDRAKLFAADVAHCGPRDESLVLGIAFNAERTASFGVAQERIHAHVMKCQREFLQRKER